MHEEPHEKEMKMKGKRKLVLALIVATAVSVFVSACGSSEPQTLEEYVTSNQSEQDAIQGIVSDDPNATVTINGNTMEITYMVDDVNFTADILNNALNSLGDTFSGVITDLETETGIDGINIKVTYVDEKGKEITSKVFE